MEVKKSSPLLLEKSDVQSSEYTIFIQGKNYHHGPTFVALASKFGTFVLSCCPFSCQLIVHCFSPSVLVPGNNSQKETSLKRGFIYESVKREQIFFIFTHCSCHWDSNDCTLSRRHRSEDTFSTRVTGSNGPTGVGDRYVKLKTWKSLKAQNVMLETPANHPMSFSAYLGIGLSDQNPWNPAAQDLLQAT